MIPQLRTTLSNLRKYTNYSITVLSYTTTGEGVRSDPVYCHTDEDGKLPKNHENPYTNIEFSIVVPLIPADIKAVLSAPNKILVSWLPPKFSNGPLVSYSLYVTSIEDGKEEGTHKKPINPSVEIFEYTRANPGATCQFWVAASTRVSQSDTA